MINFLPFGLSKIHETRSPSNPFGLMRLLLLPLVLVLLPFLTARAQTEPRDHTTVGGVTYFSAFDEEHGRELWKTDANGTALVKDILPGPGSSDPYSFRVMDGSVYFVASVKEGADQYTSPIRSLMKANPDAEGVEELKRFSEEVYKVYDDEVGIGVGNLMVIGNTLYFSTSFIDNELGLTSTLWKTDGTAGGTETVREFPGSISSSGLGDFHEVNGLLVFTHQVYSRDGIKLWRSDGTQAGTYAIKHYAYLRNFNKKDGLLYFTHYSDGYYFPSFPDELWRTNGTLEGTVQVADPCPNLGSILREYWTDVSSTGTGVNAIPVNTLPTATSFLTSFEGPANVGNSYGSRIRGYICPPQTGEYTFWISGDNNVELWLSTDDDPANRRKIAEHRGFTAPRQWDKHPSQKSQPIRLETGKRYYIEALHKEDNVNDHVAVAWQLPDGAMQAPIPGDRLAPFMPEEEYAPVVRLTAPLTGQTCTRCQPITIKAEAEVLYSEIENVRFIAMGPSYHVTLGFAVEPPYNFTWSGLPAGTYQLIAEAKAVNGKVARDQITIHVEPGPNSILREQWDGVPGQSVYSVPVHTAPSSTSLLSSFEGPANVGDSYGSRIRGYVCPPTSGYFTFSVAGDNNVNLYLSTDTDPTNKRLIAYLTGFTAPREWDKYPSQTSEPVYLRAGHRYYIESLHKEGAVGDHVAVAWRMPDGTFEAPIAGNWLFPFELATAAVASNQLSAGDPELSAFPNPFSDQTTLQFTLPEGGEASLEVYDLQGRLVRQLFAGIAEAGVAREFAFDGRELASGIYIAKLVTGSQVLTMKIMLNK